MEQAGHRTKTRKGGNDPAFAPQTALAQTLFVLVVPALSQRNPTSGVHIAGHILRMTRNPVSPVPEATVCSSNNEGGSNGAVQDAP